MAATSRQRQKAATRAAIMRTAAEEFDAHGYSATSVARIADRLRLTKGSVYFHFASKAELAAEVALAGADVWEPILRSLDDDGLTGLDALQRLSVEVAGLFRDDVMLRAAVRLTRQGPTAELPDPFTSWISVVRRCLDRAVGAGEVRPGVDVDALAWQLVATFLGMQELARRVADPTDPVDRLDGLWNVVLDGVRAP
ncbi:ScbR family autoregulator-binding transcription factor [Isoptericola sp. G70]|uniref:ScbR family autoregulator-binding transcription factor n=1 Tax=Isoptericola sp. G70 TaxID=3376633 RepID=UPI003A800BDC